MTLIDRLKSDLQEARKENELLEKQLYDHRQILLRHLAQFDKLNAEIQELKKK